MNLFHRTVAKLGTLAALLCLASTAALAQISTGSMAGTVADSTGGVIPGAAVVATETQSGSVYKTTTTSSGGYFFTSLRPGTYNVSVTAPGFKVATATGIPVYVTSRAAHDFALATGDVSETVTVDANAPSLETETSDIGTVITDSQVQDLPSPAGGAFRSLAQFTFLAPGAVGPGTNGGLAFTKIGGGQTFGSDNLLDGISTQRSENGTELFDQMTPSLDALGEVKVETLALPAYLGRTTGGMSVFKTRSGTNTYHGTVYDFYRNTIFDANNWFFKGQAALQGFTQDHDPNATQAFPNPYRRPDDLHQDYGVTLGGPVRIPHFYDGRDKTFFFFSFEKVPTSSGYLAEDVVPTLAERGLSNGSNGAIGDFSADLGASIGVTNKCTNQPILAGQIFDPNTTQNVGGTLCRTPFTNNQVPIGRSAVAQKVLALIPLPNVAQTNGPHTVNYVYPTVTHISQTGYSLRLDQNFGSRHHLFFFGSSRENFDSGQPNFSNQLDSGSQLQDFYAKLLRVGYDFTINPHLVNQITFGGNRINSFNSAPPSLLGVNYDAQLGIPNTPGAGTNFPIFNIGGITGIGSSNFDDNVDNALIIDDNLSISKGRHNIKVGGTYRWQEFSYINNGAAAGNFSFGNTQTSAQLSGNVTSLSGNGLASFLLGAPSGVGRTLQLHAPRWIQTYVAGYGQDDWKLLHNLTLNLGLRYSFDTPRHEAEGDISSFDPTLPNPAASGRLGAYRYGGVGPGRDGLKNEQFANTYYKDFEPRVGFAWAPGFWHDSTVIRASYTIMYGPLIYADYGQGLGIGFTTSSASNSPDGFSPSGSLDAGPPTVSQTPITDPTYQTGTTNTIDYVAKGDGKPAMVQNFTLDWQTELAPDLILSIAYLGERGTRLRSLVYWENSLNPAYFGLGDALTAQLQSPQGQATGVPTPYANFFASNADLTVGHALLPFPQYEYINNDSYLQNRGQSTYNAFTAKLDRKFRNGLNLLASYTWSKTFTDADSIQPFYSTVQAQSGTQNPYNLKGERSLSIADVPNNFVVSYLYDLPVGKGKRFLGNSNRVVNAVIGNFRVGGVQRYLSGQPIGFFGAAGVPYFDGAPRFDRAVGVPLVTPAATSKHYNPLAFQAVTTGKAYNPTAFWNPNAFIDVNDFQHRGTGAFRFGDMPRNDAEVRTRPFLNEDLNLNKHFPIREQISADLRLEVFNAFNRHVFAKPDSGVYDLNFGQITGLNDSPRSMQLMVKIHY